MARILVTGFGPFGLHVRNPSGEVAEAIAATGRGKVTLAAVVLPVRRDRAFAEARDVMDRFGPDVVIALGLGAGRTAIGIEKLARNVDDYAEPDEGGALPRGEAVVGGAPAVLEATLSTDGLLGAIRGAGVPVEISHDAGTFLCNHLYFALLHHAETLPPERRYGCAFLHLPPVADSGGSIDSAIRALGAAIDFVAAAPG